LWSIQKIAIDRYFHSLASSVCFFHDIIFLHWLCIILLSLKIMITSHLLGFGWYYVLLHLVYCYMCEVSLVVVLVLLQQCNSTTLAFP
jgi:hypothetical protein